MFLNLSKNCFQSKSIFYLINPIILKQNSNKSISNVSKQLYHGKIIINPSSSSSSSSVICYGRCFVVSKSFNRSINIAGDSINEKNSWKNIKKSRSPFGYLFVILPIATFCLGTWQIYRLQWKLDLIKKLESIINKDAIDLPPIDQLESIDEMEYTKVKVRGYFDLSTQPQFIFPRSLITRDEQNNQGSLISSSSKGSSQGLGAQLILPFVITDEKYHNSNNKPLKILVNLGWVPRETIDKVNSIWKKFNLEETKPNEINLIGVIRKTEKREPFTPKQEFTQGYWTRRDIEKLSQKLNTWPIYLDAFESYPIKFLLNNDNKQFLELNPIGGQTRVNLRNEHLSYIITWYSLTGIFSYLWYKKIFLSRI